MIGLIVLIVLAIEVASQTAVVTLKGEADDRGEGEGLEDHSSVDR